MEFTVNVEKIDLAEHVASHYDDDGDRVPSGTLADLVAHQLVVQFAKSDSYRGLAERVRTIRDEEIRKLLEPTLTEAFTGPIHATNSYGEKTGAATTLRELIMAEAKKITTLPSDSYSRDKGTRLQQIIRAEVDAAFKAEIAQAVKDAREAVGKEFGSTISEAITAAVRDAMRAR
jgi:hypothetical protein